jgi:hypothetical protein
VVPLRYNARSLIERRTTSLMTMMGVALVAMIFVILFGFIGGLRRTMLSAGNDNNWVIVARGAPDGSLCRSERQPHQTLQGISHCSEASSR